MVLLNTMIFGFALTLRSSVEWYSSTAKDPEKSKQSSWKSWKVQNGIKVSKLLYGPILISLKSINSLNSRKKLKRE